MKNTKIKFSRLGISVFILTVFLICNMAAGEAASEPEPNAITPLAVRMQKPISIDFRNTPIEDALILLADQADVDIVKSPEVTGMVTVKLTNVPLEEALKNILAAHGYGFMADKNMIRVGPIEQMTQAAERIESKTYRIIYADIKEVATALDRFKSAQGSVTYVQGTSNLIVTDTESKIRAIDKFLEEIDRITPQVLVEARIYDMSLTDQFDLGVEWYLGRNTNYGDAGPAKVGTNPSGRTEPFATSVFDSAITQTPKTEGLIRFGILNSAINLDALLTANQEKVHAKLLACPRVLVLDHEKATFKIIEERPFQQLTQATAGAGGAIGTTMFKEVGVELEVTPHIAPKEGMVRLHIKPVFSVQTDTVSIVIPIAGAPPILSPQPVVAKREADTKVLVQDGQTVVLGGLRKQDLSKELSKIPLLGDLPLLGGLFRFEGERAVTSEVVVFITPRIVQQPIMTELEKKQLAATEFEGPELAISRAEKAAKKQQIKK